MNRELKFRAWNEGQMIYPSLEGHGAINSGEILKRFETVMQYTGLKDKNGKEIYEGDLCKDDDGQIHQVIGNPGYFSFAGGVMGCGDLEQSQMLIEVIGNIYENPELLSNTISELNVSEG